MLHTPCNKIWIGTALLTAAGIAHAREPTRADVVFCKSFAGFVQAELDAHRSGDPGQVTKFQQALAHYPLASQVLSMGLGWNNDTPPWVSDVTDAAQAKCLTIIRSDRWGYLPGDPERPHIDASSHPRITTQVHLPTAPPPDDQFEGRFQTAMGSEIKVMFRRHAAICWGGIVAHINRQGMRPLESCVKHKAPDAYVVPFSQSSGFGEVRVLYSTMRPLHAAAALGP